MADFICPKCRSVMSAASDGQCESCSVQPLEENSVVVNVEDDLPHEGQLFSSRKEAEQDAVRLEYESLLRRAKISSVFVMCVHFVLMLVVANGAISYGINEGLDLSEQIPAILISGGLVAVYAGLAIRSIYSPLVPAIVGCSIYLLFIFFMFLGDPDVVIEGALLYLISLAFFLTAIVLSMKAYKLSRKIESQRGDHVGEPPLAS